MRKEVLAAIALAAPVIALGVRRAVAGAAPPAPPTSPTGSMSLEALATEKTIVARVTVTATAGTLPVTAEVHCAVDSVEDVETVTITELNKGYTVEFTFPVSPGTYTVKAWAILRNVVGEVTVGPQWQTVYVYAPFTITVRAVADSTEVSVSAEGAYPTGTYDTPFDISVTEDLKDKVLAFWFPANIELAGIKYGIDTVTNGWIDRVEADKALVKFLADEAKEVVVKYSESPALAQWSSSKGSWIKVWDAWYREETNVMSKVEIVENSYTREYTPYVSGGKYYYRWTVKIRLVEGVKPKVIVEDTSGHGVIPKWQDSYLEYTATIWEPYRPDKLVICVDDTCKEVPAGYTGTVEISVTKRYMGIDASFNAIGDEDVIRYWVFDDPVTPAKDWYGRQISGLVFYIDSGHVRKEWEAKSKSDIKIIYEMYYSDYPTSPAWFQAILISKDQVREL